MAHDSPRGIPGIHGKEPVGCVLSMGVKTPRGPQEKDRLHLLSPVAGHDDVRTPHPMMGGFNAAPPAARQVVYGALAHHTVEECFEYRYRAQKGPGMGHPNRRAFCEGDGKRASRWTGKGPDDFQDMACPAERCEFRQGDRPLCGPWMRFLFRLKWLRPDTVMPTPLTKFSSKGWATISHFVGFFEHVEAAAAGLGLPGYSLMGLPVQLMMSERTSSARKTRFPILTIAPVVDPVEFFRRQVEDRRAFLDAPRVVSLLEAGSEGGHVVEDADYAAHMPGVASAPRRLHEEE